METTAVVFRTTLASGVESRTTEYTRLHIALIRARRDDDREALQTTIEALIQLALSDPLRVEVSTR